jgi:hypothetical protein
MQRTTRRAAALAAALLAVGAASTTPALAAGQTSDRASAVRFAADSGDRCRYGYTAGTLDWRPITAPPTPAEVLLTGYLADRPFREDPGVGCVDDQRFTYATYSAYSRGILVDEAVRRVDNNQVAIEVPLRADVTRGPIDTVVIEVCRVSLTSSLPRPDYCGPAQRYLRP